MYFTLLIQYMYHVIHKINQNNEKHLNVVTVTINKQ